MKILVLGCKGQLGLCLNDQLINSHNEVIYTSREQIDIGDFLVTKSKIFNISPDVIVNATAYTAVDNAEEDKKSANLINHLAVKNIAEICNQLGCWLVHVSTDYVFDGRSQIPYKEDDKTNPQCVYGETKLKGELSVKASGCTYIIIRTAWVFSEYGNNFLKTMLRLGTERDELSIIGDQIGCPTYAQDLARTIAVILHKLNSSEDLKGVYHYCGETTCSWYEFAMKIFDCLSTFGVSSPKNLKTIETSDYPVVAKRPPYSVLSCEYINEKFKIEPSNLDLAIKTVLTTILQDKENRYL